MPPQLPITNYQLPTTRPRAFTLLELLVVVAIIAVLIAILVPAINGAQRRAQITQTTAQMTGFSNAIEQYYQVFNAYPGPATSNDMSGNTACTLTGTQNLLLGLTYAMVPAADATYYATNYPTNVQFPSPKLVIGNATPAGLYVDLGKSSVVNDFSNLDSAGNPRTYPSFYNFSNAKNELTPPTSQTTSSITYPAWGQTITEISTRSAAPLPWNFPTIYDRFPDPRPILYFRKTPGVDGTAQFTPTPTAANLVVNNVSPGAPATGATTAAIPGTPSLVAMNHNAGTIASYYLDDNYPYFNTAFQTKSSYSPSEIVASSAAGYGICDFANAVNTKSSPTGNATLTARGGYVLISAGPDGVYGRVKQGNDWLSPLPPSDDIILIGGH